MCATIVPRSYAMPPPHCEPITQMRIRMDHNFDSSHNISAPTTRSNRRYSPQNLILTMFRTVQKPLASAGRRLMATTVRNPLLPRQYQNQTFKTNFLSDPSTYPIIVIMSCKSNGQCIKSYQISQQTREFYSPTLSSLLVTCASCRRHVFHRGHVGECFQQLQGTPNQAQRET
jgi:hypothetical protein